MVFGMPERLSFEVTTRMKVTGLQEVIKWSTFSQLTEDSHCSNNKF